MKSRHLLSFVLPSLMAAAVFAGTTGQAGNAYQAYLKALLLESQGNFAGAQEEVNRAIELSPSSAYLHRTAAELALNLGQVPKAAEEIEKATALEPSNVRILVLAGQIEWALGNTADAEAKLRKAVKMDPDQSDAVLSLAGALTAKAPDEAISLYKSYMVRHPNDPDLLERLAQLYQSNDKTAEAEATWKELMAVSPNSPRAHLAMAQIAEVHQDTAAAIVHYDALIAQDPTNLPLLLRVGELRYRNNDMVSAEEAFRKAKSVAPDSAAPNFWLALLAEHRADWPEAIKMIKQIPDADKDSGMSLRLSYYYAQNKQYAETVKVLKHMVETDPTNPDFLNYLASAYEQNNDKANAEKTLKRIIEIDPNEPEAHFHLATLYDRTKRFTLAEQELQAAIRLRPGFDMALNYLGYSYAERNIKLEEAERLVNDAIAASPHNPAYLDSMGWVLYRMKKYDRAKDFLTEAATLAGDPVVWDHLADVELAGGHPQDALLAWDQSLRLDPKSKEPRAKSQRAFSALAVDAQKLFSEKRAVVYFGGISSIQGLAKATVNMQPGKVAVNAQFAYKKKSELRLEMPGPLGAPLFLLTKEASKPAEFGALHPQLEAARPLLSHAFDRLWDVLNAAAFIDKQAQVSFDAKSGAVVSIVWPEGKLTLSKYDPLNFSHLPDAITWTDSASKQSLELRLTKPVVEIFTPQQP